MLSNTSTEWAPWYVIPADDKKNARLIVAQILLDQIKTWCADSRTTITVKPVIDLARCAGVDRYDVPDAMAEQERRGFHHEFATYRFRPVSEHGAWEGRTGLVPRP